MSSFGQRLGEALPIDHVGTAHAMTFALQSGEPVGEGLRRCAAEELDDAVGTLRNAADADVASAVHSARKSCKKVRALLRLVRPALGDDVRDRENDALRDASDLLSAARDVEVLASLLEDLAQADGAPAALSDGVMALRQRRDGLAHVVRAGDASAAAARIEAVEARVEHWPLTGGVDELLAPGLAKLARQERKRRDKALAAGLRPADRPRPLLEELRHDWRKRAKDLWYCARLLKEVSEPAASAVGGLDELGDALGEDHDAAVLASHLRADPGESGLAALLRTSLHRASDREQLRGILQRRRVPLVEQAQALSLGRPHAADPDTLVDTWLQPLREG